MTFQDSNVHAQPMHSETWEEFADGDMLLPEFAVIE